MRAIARNEIELAETRIYDEGSGVNHVRVWAKVKLDNTGNYIQLPVILMLTDCKLSVLEPLLRYFIIHFHQRSHSWMVKLCEISGLLIDYLEVNRRLNYKPVRLFEGFITALYNGTFDEVNRDPSGLCWLPSNAKTINPKLCMLEEFSDWMSKQNYLAEPLNPWTDATSIEQRFNWISWFRRNQYSFLGHIGLTGRRSAELEQARIVKLRRNPLGKNSCPKAFPSNFEVALLRDGFVRPGKDNEADILEKYDWRGICIAILLLYGARRLSEPFHLWTGDVMENPTRSGDALVRIYHPIEGQAPENPKINGRRATNRQAYLKAFYPKYPPRNLATGNYFAGFKGRAFTDEKALFIHVYWLPSDMAKTFMWTYHNYMLQRARLGIDGSRHPFAFVSHAGKYKGEPYTIKAFIAVWARAVKRIGLPHAKIYGTTTHGGRHGAGIRANKGHVSEYDAQEMFAHSSPESQRVYRSPSPEQVTESMETATRRIYFEEKFNGTDITFLPTHHNLMESWQAHEDQEHYLRNTRKRK
ncbi:MAG: gamma-mobile-trio recombinase GmtY [Burkholderiaceae bacterium]